ncbi:hypothetical protein SAMN04487977_10783 [Treponema bryantii]|uniref:Uncharacterized protein n=1 Tax=Treponema bryantii TaxID=163 RepID=A0A1H9HND8_9SPIR|nr:hypothetical protein [Treponema bryantii]SEQ63808.1 hypothetical protein SAMN04487977_10783 [Treponema bryantii]
MKNSVNKLAGLFLLLLFCAQPLYSANVLGRPRRMSLIKTEYFDIIYSKESEETALLLVQNVDRLYQKAADALNSQHKLRMPVIISPDSDVLSVDYTPYPYNRIIIFDSTADYDTAVFKDSMLGLFYREIYKALSQSIRSPFNQFVAKWIAGDSYQPVALFNLPYSFIEGNAYLAESSEGEGLLNDGYFLQLLSQAKLEGKIPQWSQVITVRDTYPGEELALAAGTGFSAFLMNTYGAEKYAELWEESGKINPLLTHGVFKNTYGLTLTELWNQFEESVPLPASLMALESYEKEGELVFPKDKDANYEHILITDYGTVWYDRIRHEVDIFDEHSQLKMRQILFLADKIERMSLSPDGRFIAVTNIQPRSVEGLYSVSASIYDLKERKFLDQKYQLRDTAIVLTETGDYAVAGVNIKDVTPALEIHTMPLDEKKKEKPTLIFRQDFARNTIPFSPVYSGNGFVAYIRAEGTERYLCRLNFGKSQDNSKEQNLIEQSWLIKADGQKDSEPPLKIQYLSCQRRGGSPIYTFTYTQPGDSTFTRAGFIFLTDKFEPAAVRLTSTDVSGGIHYPFVSSRNELFYSAKKYSQNQLRKVDLSAVELENGYLQKAGKENLASANKESGNHSQSSLSDYNVRNYNPFKYMTDLSFTPFFPIKILDLNEGNLYWPGLGVSIENQPDPCMNTQAVLSLGWTYLPLDFSWTKNMPSSYLARIRSESLNLKKDKSAAFYIENSSTPVKIRAGAIFNFNLDGEYNFKILAGTQWKIPLGLALRQLIFDIQGSYTVSTDYYDQTKSDIRPGLSAWPSFRSAYELYEISAKVEYTNIHQYGYSTFEQRGLSVGVRSYLMWDMCEVRLLQEARKNLAPNNSNLTNAEKKNLLSETISDITQFNVGLFATIAIPRLLPFSMKDNWIFSMPGVINAEFVNKPGTALESSFKVLLIGREIHNSVIPYVLYSRRAGLWFGYNMALVYDTSEVRLPDIRHADYLAEVFQGVSYTQAIYLILNLDLNITTGKLATVPINTTLTGTYYPESHGYGISLDVRFHL